MRIKELRETAGMRQTELAENMGIMQNTVSCWETETALPKSRQLPLLAAVLGCTIEELYTDEAKNSPMPTEVTEGSEAAAS